MSKAVKPEDLGKALQKELTQYHDDVIKRVNTLSEGAAKKLVKLTKATAPVASGSFRKNIAAKMTTKGYRGNVYSWYVKAPDYRLTHLLVHGHATRNGGRTKADPFLANALKTVTPEYEKAVEEAVRE